MMDAGRHPKINLLSYSEVEEVSGYIGNFSVKVRKKARCVNEEACTGCGTCQDKCPAKVLDTGFEAGMGKRKAIYRPFAQAIPNIPVIDKENCIWFIRGKCGACKKLCPTGAIDFEQQDKILDLEVGTIIVATGFAMWDPKQLPQYSYGKSPNIITGLQFERLTSAIGPTGGEILTAEGKKPEKVAIIHCVGSRDHNAHEYCSRICCMYSLKHAHQVHDKTGAEVYAFYMDMRSFGKAYEEFYEHVQEEGITFVRGRGAEVDVLPSGKLRVKGEDANLGRIVAADVDMVILASAIESQPDASRVSTLFGLGRSPDGFFAEAHPKLRPVETNTDGVFLAGCAQGPRDVPDTVAHAGAAASMAIALMDKAQVTISPATALVDERYCSACKTCIALCPYNAISFVPDDNVARVNETLCKGCGTCVAACPAGAITARHFTDEQIMAQIEGLFQMPAMAEVAA
jgi:heterodisulfide reductase subunit A